MRPIATASVRSTPVHWRHDIQTGTHALVTDEPAHGGGGDAGPAPYDFVLAGLGACTAITLRMYAERKGWDLGDFRVELVLSKNAAGDASVQRTLYSSVALSAEQWERLMEIAGKTPVTKTLLAGMAISTQSAQSVRDGDTGRTAD